MNISSLSNILFGNHDTNRLMDFYNYVILSTISGFVLSVMNYGLELIKT